ncbi:MAG: hypothetical protein JSR57_11250, partial [Verrucomicrobia bacterium]|nr:hypothetical protein [Verrucomicrobiota bacterium]
PSRSEQSARTVREDLSETLRSARQIQFNLQQEADQLIRRPDATIEQLSPLHEQIRRLEQQIQRLSQQLGIPQSSIQATATDTSPLVQRIFDRLSRIEERLRQLESYEATQPTSSGRIPPLSNQDLSARREDTSAHQRSLSDVPAQTDRNARREDGSTRQRSQSDTGAQTDRTPTREDDATHQRSRSDVGAQTDSIATRTDNSRHQRVHSDSTARSDPPSQREADLESALQRAREAYRNLQQDADRLSRQLHVTIDQLAPLHTQIRRLETQVQRLSEQLGNPLIATSDGTQTQTTPILERIQDRLSRIDEHLSELEGPRLIPAGSSPSSDRVDALEQERNQLEAQLREVTKQLDVLRERNLELSTQLSTLTSPSPNLPRLTNEQFRLLLSLAQQLGHPSVRDSEDFPFGTDTQFLDLPQEIRDSVYFQMYSICYPTRVPDTWRCGEKFFLNQEGLHGNNGLRSLAITRYLNQSLANEFATLGNGQASSPDVMARFDLLAEEDQIGILRQYQFLHRKSEEPLETTRESFLGLNDTTATNEERNEAISRYLQVQISERYGKMISELTDELLRLAEQLDSTQDSYEEALDRLRLEMAQLREQSRLDLASAMFHASSIQSELDTARGQIAQLTGDLSSKDLQIAALHQQASEAAEQQQRAREQIDQLTRIGRGKDIDIAQLRINLRQAGERERCALDEIARLTLEASTKDSRISALEQDIRNGA